MCKNKWLYLLGVRPKFSKRIFDLLFLIFFAGHALFFFFEGEGRTWGIQLQDMLSSFSFTFCLIWLYVWVLFPCLAGEKHESAIQFLGFELICVYWLIQSV